MIIVNVDAGVDEVEEEKLNAARKETNDQLDVVVDGGQEDDGMTASQVGYDLPIWPQTAAMATTLPWFISSIGGRNALNMYR